MLGLRFIIISCNSQPEKSTSAEKVSHGNGLAEDDFGVVKVNSANLAKIVFMTLGKNELPAQQIDCVAIHGSKDEGALLENQCLSNCATALSSATQTSLGTIERISSAA